jgi:hypothetical protein
MLISYIEQNRKYLKNRIKNWENAHQAITFLQGSPTNGRGSAHAKYHAEYGFVFMAMDDD